MNTNTLRCLALVAGTLPCAAFASITDTTDSVVITGERASYRTLAVAGPTKTDALSQDLPQRVRCGRHSRFPNMPRHGANVLLVAGDAKASIGAGAAYVGERFGDVAASSDFRLPAYTTARLLADDRRRRQPAAACRAAHGERVWRAAALVPQADALHTAMSFLNFTNYPPSLDFILLTLGVGLLVLAWLERIDNGATRAAAVFGGGPLFYYLLHLYALLALQRIAAGLLDVPGADVDHVWQVWLITVALAAALYWPTLRFGRYKRESGKGWVKYC